MSITYQKSQQYHPEITENHKWQFKGKDRDHSNCFHEMQDVHQGHGDADIDASTLMQKIFMQNYRIYENLLVELKISYNSY